MCVGGDGAAGCLLRCRPVRPCVWIGGGLECRNVSGRQAHLEGRNPICVPLPSHFFLSRFRTLLTQAAAQVEAERREAVARAERERVEQAAHAAARIALDREQRASAASVERLAAEAAAAEAAAEMAEFNYLQMLAGERGGGGGIGTRESSSDQVCGCLPPFL